MKRKIFSAVLAFVMLLTLAPVALAQGETGPYVTNLFFRNNNVTYNTSTSPDNIITIQGTESVVGLHFGATFNEAVDFEVLPGLTESGGTYVPGPDLPRGAMYVSSVNDKEVHLNLNISTGSADFNDEAMSLILTTEDYITWEGDAPVFELLGANLFMVAHNLYNPVVIPAGSAKSRATGELSAINNIIINNDGTNVYIREGGAGVDIYTVTYICNSETFVWKAPDNSAITYPIYPQYSTLNFAGWYLDEDYTDPVPATYRVTGDVTVYAKYEPKEASTFADQLVNPDIKEVTIETKDDFEVFANQASDAGATKLVKLGLDLDFTGDAATDKTFQAISYKGNFDGGGYTITGATFTPNGDNAGMFASIGQDQIIANLNLDDITVEYAQNAGVLAGSVSANSGDTPQDDRPIIQNIQVTNSDVSGQNSGGIVGFTFIAIIRYCSVSDSTVYGFVNAGGIAAQSYSDVNNCYTKNVTLNSLIAQYRGGIVSNLLEASSVTHCWTTYERIEGRNTQDRPVTNCITEADYSSAEEATAKGFSSNIWNLADPLSDSTFTDEVFYKFDAPSIDE